MYLHLTEESHRLVEPQDVRSLSVLCSADLDGEALAAAARQAGLSSVPGGSHLLIPVDLLRRLASGRVGPGWEADLARMVEYATSRGWVDEEGTSLRAHIERLPEG
jgi:hypothetical protein